MNAITRLVSFRRILTLLDEEATEEIEIGSWRHGSTYRYVVELDGKHWSFWLRCHQDEGFGGSNGEQIEMTQVTQREKQELMTRTEWVPVMTD